MPAESQGADASGTRTGGPSALGLALCVALALAQGLWSLFQWAQLFSARTGGDAYCGLVGATGGGSGDARPCLAIWDVELATTIQTTSGLPIAGWGVVWSLVAFAVPLWALARSRGTSQAGADVPASAPGPPLAQAMVVLATGGVAALAYLAIESPRALMQCGACVTTCALMLSYALVTLLETPRGWTASTARGMSLASGALGLFYVLLFVPGLRTPQQNTFASPFVAELSAEASEHRAERRATEMTSLLKQLRGRRLNDFVLALDEHRSALTLPLREPRSLLGAPDAPVRITQFTGVQCKNCARLYSTLNRLRTLAEPRSFAIDPRQYPLDRACNEHFEGEAEDTIRCLAARVQICLEGQPDVLDFTSNLYRRMRTLDEAGLYELAESIMPREELEACAGAPETEQALQTDIAYAAEYDYDGAPLVLLNGRRVPPLGPLLYALLLADADANHPAFADLPEPKPLEKQQVTETGAEGPAETGPEATDAQQDAPLRDDEPDPGRAP